jgi:hypothetical protein
VTGKATRAPRSTAEVQREILSFDIRGRSEAEIARRRKISRGSVRRTLARGRPLLALTGDRTGARICRAARGADGRLAGSEAPVQRGNSPGQLIAEVRLAQAEINRLLGLTALESQQEPTGDQFADFPQAVLRVVAIVAPDAVPQLARAVRDSARGPVLVNGKDDA